VVEEEGILMAVLEKSVPSSGGTRKFISEREPLGGAFFWLSAFYLVYCARPEDWISVLKYLPLAKISGIFAVLGLLSSAGKAKRGLRDLPIEAKYLAGIIILLFGSALLSPVWRGGAAAKTLDFAKVLIAWVLSFIVITNFRRLKQIIFIQSASVVVIAVVSLLKGREHPRLEGVIGGIYSNPNDLAFAIVLSLPFCVAFLLQSRSIPRKLIWILCMLAMFETLFLTASRGGFITLLVTGAVGLWHFGVKGKRIHLLATAALVTLVVGITAGGRLKDRFVAISGEDLDNNMEISAHGSYEQRRFLMVKSLEGIEHYPLGIGLGNFPNYSGTWHQVHVAFLQIAVEGGIAAFVLYLLFFSRGFSNLRLVRRMPGYDKETELFAMALQSSLIGFLVGALFAPEAYQYFPYFAVAYTSVLLAIAKEKEQGKEPAKLQHSQLPNREQGGAVDFSRIR
jgi:O-antigen ligase